MYRSSQAGRSQSADGRQRSRQDREADAGTAESESHENYKTNEELRREFEPWKRGATTAYDQNKHDEFLKHRYYKMRRKDEFDTGSHFSHPNSQAGPRNGPR